MARIDFAKLPTEKFNPRSKNLHRLSLEEILEIIHEEDQSLPKAVDEVRASMAQAVRLIVASLKKGGHLFLAGAGTSGRLGVIEAAECPPTFNTPPEMVQAVMAGGPKAVFRSEEGAEDRHGDGLRIFRKKLTAKDVLVGIAASGVTPFVRGSLQAAEEKGAVTILIACNTDSPLQDLADCVISPKVGPEVITGSTRLKAGTATKLILNRLTVASMIQLGKVYEHWMVDLQPKSRKLHARAVRIIETLGQVSSQEAEKYLKKAKKNVKVAIVMAKKKYGYRQAAEALKKTSRFLEPALGE